MRTRITRSPRTTRGRRRWILSTIATAALTSGLLSACGGGAGPNTLVWYINPDNGGQAAVAAACSKDKPYTIETQVLPQDAGQQRIQLARRLAAGDTGIDLMSIDPAYTAEFANAGYLAAIPQEEQDAFTKQAFEGAATAATFDGKVVVAPFWSNVQVLWYRKAFTQKAGLDMSKPVTWDQIIDAADKNHGTVAVQANKYEGYVVWINALVAGAGGDIVSDIDQGVDASIDIDSAAGEAAAHVVEKLSHSSAAPPDLSIAQEGQAAAAFGRADGAFQTDWTFIWHNYDATDPALQKDIGYAPYPETVAGKPSRPPFGGIGIGVSDFSTKKDWDMDAIACLTSPENQGINAVMTGNMPSSSAGYDYAPLKDIYPQDLLDLFQQSVGDAAPRPLSPYWSDISGAIQSTWHPPRSVTDQTPSETAQFIDDVLHGRRLL